MKNTPAATTNPADTVRSSFVRRVAIVPASSVCHVRPKHTTVRFARRQLTFVQGADAQDRLHVALTDLCNVAGMRTKRTSTFTMTRYESSPQAHPITPAHRAGVDRSAGADRACGFRSRNPRPRS